MCLLSTQRAQPSTCFNFCRQQPPGFLRLSWLLRLPQLRPPAASSQSWRRRRGLWRGKKTRKSSFPRARALYSLPLLCLALWPPPGFEQHGTTNVKNSNTNTVFSSHTPVNLSIPFVPWINHGGELRQDRRGDLCGDKAQRWWVHIWVACNRPLKSLPRFG